MEADSVSVFQLLEYQNPPNLEFGLMTNEEASSSMTEELNNLIRLAGPEDREGLATDLAEFRNLFDKFVMEPGPSVNWDKIETLPSDSVIEQILYFC